MIKNIFRRTKMLVKAAFGKELHVKVDIICKKEHFGSEYGGWDIITTSIDNNSIVYSFGIGEDASFDTELIERFDLTIHAFDPTPKSINWVKSQRFSHHFTMHEYGISGYDGDVAFNPPVNPNHISYTLLDRPSTKDKAITVKVKKLSTIMKELNHDRLDILKMDIEGAEYDVINDICKSGIRPQQILVEFHHRFPSVGINWTKEAIERLRSNGYKLFSVSAINEEFCFIRYSYKKGIVLD